MLHRPQTAPQFKLDRLAQQSRNVNFDAEKLAHPDVKRSRKTALVSDDDGATRKAGLLQDERESSHLDGIRAEDCTLFVS
jgi:hypothetical protein